MNEYAIVLGGGQSRRMGTDKLALVLDGQSLLARAVRAASRVAARVIVAGPVREGVVAEFIQEDPPFGGPVAGIDAALKLLPDDDATILLLAGDLADPEAAVDCLEHAALEADGVVLVGADGKHQWLTGKYRLSSLRRALERCGEVHGAALHRVFRELQIEPVHLDEETVEDVDTLEQALALGVDGLPESLA